MDYRTFMAIVLSWPLFLSCIGGSHDVSRIENRKFDPDICVYEALVESVYDGDTFTADVYLAFKLVLNDEKFRMYGIDAPELRGAEKEKGILARDFLAMLIMRKNVTLEVDSENTDKYGRYLAVAYAETDSGWTNVNEIMVKNGHAAIMSDK